MVVELAVLLVALLLVGGIAGFFVRISGASLPIRHGVHAEAIVKAWRYTAMRVRASGNFGSIYDLDLEVTPVGGGEPCIARVRSTVDTLMDPAIGDRVAVIISPTDPRRVKVDHRRTHTTSDRQWHTPDDAGQPHRD